MKHLILTILFTLSLFAQEIGVPYVDTREEVAISATLSPDGETFYTYANNTLTHWSLSPVKVIDSVKIEDIGFGKTPWLFIAANKKIIFANLKKGLAVFDLVSKKFIARDETKLYRVNCINNKIVNVSNQRVITQWNPENLKIVQQVQLPELHLNCDECSDFVQTVMHYGNDHTFTIVTESRFALMDNDSLKLLDQKISYNKYLQISNDHQYTSNSDEIINIRSLKSALYTDMKAVEFHNKLGRKPSSFNNKLFSTRGSFYEINSNIIQATLYSILDSDKWLIITPNGYFDGSPDTRKYLYMKAPSGESVPIDDATYNKFHKLINLKD